MASREELLDALGVLWSHDDAARFELLVDQYGPGHFREHPFPPHLPVLILEPPPGPVGWFRNSGS